VLRDIAGVGGVNVEKAEKSESGTKLSDAP
jgi:hypothetical protein